jgi:hypothetical protein
MDPAFPFHISYAILLMFFSSAFKMKAAGSVEIFPALLSLDTLACYHHPHPSKV